jgi:hypothetical protein
MTRRAGADFIIPMSADGADHRPIRTSVLDPPEHSRLIHDRFPPRGSSGRRSDLWIRRARQPEDCVDEADEKRQE